MKLEKLIAVILVLLLFCFISSCTDNVFQMSSVAMEPTIENGEIITADFDIYKKETPKRWDIVLFHSPTLPNTDWLMRIVGLPGETVSYDSLGLLINGNRIRLENSLITYKLYCAGVDSSTVIKHPFVIPQDQYYVLGDNVDDSYDSRFWGSVPKEDIYGLVSK